MIFFGLIGWRWWTTSHSFRSIPKFENIQQIISIKFKRFESAKDIQYLKRYLQIIFIYFTNNSRSFFFSFSSSTSLVTDIFAKVLEASSSSLVGAFVSLLVDFFLKKKRYSSTLKDGLSRTSRFHPHWYFRFWSLVDQ